MQEDHKGADLRKRTAYHHRQEKKEIKQALKREKIARKKSRAEKLAEIERLKAANAQLEAGKPNNLDV